MRRLAGALACAGPAAFALAASITPFSSAPPGGALPDGWREQRIANAKPAQVSLERDSGALEAAEATVLRVRSAAAAGGAVFSIQAPGRSILAWRWRVDGVVAGADMGARSGDDYAARLYVFFDVPEASLPFATRMKMRLARALHGTQLPTAALCYVWDNRNPPGTTAWNAYTDRVRMIVVDSGAAKAGRWVEVRRDLDADFRAAFGGEWPGPTPAVTGIAAANDTDQTGATATAWFGDLRLSPAE